MPILHVRDVSEVLYQDLQDRARRDRRSLSAEVIHLLSVAVGRRERSVTEILASIESRRRPATAGAPSSLDLLREDRAS